MISALAFGYGVGMAAPEGALDKMRQAVGAPAPAGHPLLVAADRGPARAALRTGRVAYVPQHDDRAGVDEMLGRFRDEAAGLTKLRERGAAGRAMPPGREQSLAADVDDGEDSFRESDELDDDTQQMLSRLQLPDFRVPITRRSLSYVRFLTRSDRGRDMFATWLKRSGRYSEMIQQELRERSLPEDLIWVAMIESGFDPRAKSPAGAVGLWQFMQATGDVYDLIVNKYVDERRNPVKATRAAAQHLRDLYERFGAWDLALAAYNMGYEQLLSAIDRAGTTDFWELSRQHALPKETAAYVPKIVAAALVANNLERYGFDDVKVARPVLLSELGVPPGTSLRTIARAAGMTQSDFRKINPHLLAAHIPPGEGVYPVLLPADAMPRARAALPAMLEDKYAYRDTAALEPIGALDFASTKTWDEDESRLEFLPKPKRRSLRSVLGNKAGDPARDGDGDRDADRMLDELDPQRRGRETLLYRVGPGDSLIAVARQFAVDVDVLARDNGLDASDMLKEGALLRVSVKPEVLARWKKHRGGDGEAKPSAAKKKSKS